MLWVSLLATAPTSTPASSRLLPIKGSPVLVTPGRHLFVVHAVRSGTVRLIEGAHNPALTLDQLLSRRMIKLRLGRTALRSAAAKAATAWRSGLVSKRCPSRRTLLCSDFSSCFA